MTSNELDDLFSDDSKPKKQYPWSSILDAADNYSEKAFEKTLGFEESNKSNQYYAKAMELYQEAADLGCLMAYEKLGDMCKKGEGVSKDDQKALDIYKEGVKKGNYFCYSGIADIFIEQTNTEKFHKSYSLFFKYRKERINLEIEEQNNREFWIYCFLYVNTCFEYGIRPLKEVIEDMAQQKHKISDHILKIINFHKETDQMLAESNARLTFQFSDYQPSVSIQDTRKEDLKKLKDMQDWVNENL